LLDSIYRLGIVQTDEKLSITSLLTTVTAKYVIGIQFQNNKSNLEYIKSEIYEFQDPILYLYKRDSSGKPGLFLTGNISKEDIKKLKYAIERFGLENQDVKEFIRKKILWFPKSKIISENRLKRLCENRRKKLHGIFKEFKIKENQIIKDVLGLLVKDEPEKTLLTIMIQENDDEDGVPKFIGQIQDYTEFFKESILTKKFNGGKELYCTVCNNKSIIETFVERPLPFFVADKPMFFPNAEDRQSSKGFPLCDNCYLEIQKGVFLIQSKLNYKITTINSNASQLRFWLVPHLNDQELIIDFESDLNNPNLYLNVLKKLCETLQSISRHDNHKREGIEIFARFSALFYVIDDKGMMRISNYIQGIYPTQLEKLFMVKERVDEQYPFQLLRKRFGENLFVGFPLIIMFYKDAAPQWQQQAVSLLEKIFTSQFIEIEDTVKYINAKIYETSKSYNLYQLAYVTFLGLMLLEYLININAEDDGKPLSNQQEEKSTPIIKEIEIVQRFTEEHQNLLIDGASRAIFAIGVCIGILLEVQEIRYNKTAPFWNRLNRLNVDKDKLKELVPEIRSKLAMYNERRYNTIIDYLVASEISKIDDPTILSKEMVNLIFSIGLSFGSLLKRGFIK
jgi:CRISPR-associated protein Cas8b/Csh1 subtype I-B